MRKTRSTYLSQSIQFLIFGFFLSYTSFIALDLPPPNNITPGQLQRHYNSALLARSYHCEPLQHNNGSVSSVVEDAQTGPDHKEFNAIKGASCRQRELQCRGIMEGCL